MNSLRIALTFFAVFIINNNINAETYPSSVNVEYSRSFSSYQIGLSNGVPINIRARLTNNNDFSLKGIYLSEQIPNSINVETISVTIGGVAVGNYQLETGEQNSIYTGYTPHYWILASPSNLDINLIPAGSTIEITYRLTGGSYGTYSMNNDGFFGITNSEVDGFFCYDDRSVTIGVVDVTGIVEDENIVTDYNLLTAYPNPFNPSVTIEFNLDKPQITRLDLYNVSGQYIASLQRGELAAGNHKVYWDGTNQFNQKVTSGIYFGVFSKDGNVKKTIQLVYTK